MEQRTLKNVNNYLNTSVYTYLDTSGGQRSNVYFTLSTPELIRHLWQLQTILLLPELVSNIFRLPKNIYKYCCVDTQNEVNIDFVKSVKGLYVTHSISDTLHKQHSA
jgi:hypothetical protein